MYQALYRKYRPVTFSDVVGQDHITTAIRGSIKANKISHAYLFTGTRGTGKTTCAKILAKAICCLEPVDGEPCGKCEACLAIQNTATTDISEIDAASNNGINDIRDLKEQVSFLPAVLKYRVYIVDEVHMLSTPAFNALLKTLEEPPSHVVFILATTEVHKLPATILSRCQRFDFKRLEPETIVKRIQHVADKEGFTVSDGAAVMVASLADGGMRDALSILDQCSSCSSNVTEEVIKEVCGIAGTESTFEILKAINQKDTATAVKTLDKLYRNSVDMKKLLFELSSRFRDLMMIKTVKESRGLVVCSEEEYQKLCALAESFSLSDVIDCLTTLQEAADGLTATTSRSDAELVIVKLCAPELGSSLAGLKARIVALEKTVARLSVGGATARPASAAATETPAPVTVPASVEQAPLPEAEQPAAEEEKPTAEAVPQTEASSTEPKPTKSAEPPVPVDKWPEIIEILRVSCPLMSGVLAGSRAYIGGGRLLIDSQLSQFKELINSDAKYRDYIRSAAEQVLGVSYNLGPYKPPESEKKTVAADPLAEFTKRLNQNK